MLWTIFSGDQLRMTEGSNLLAKFCVDVFAREGLAGVRGGKANEVGDSARHRGQGPMDQRIESLLADVLALAGEEPDAAPT
jgi:hypothetical protein